MRQQAKINLQYFQGNNKSFPPHNWLLRHILQWFTESCSVQYLHVHQCSVLQYSLHFRKAEGAAAIEVYLSEHMHGSARWYIVVHCSVKWTQWTHACWRTVICSGAQWYTLWCTVDTCLVMHTAQWYTVDTYLVMHSVIWSRLAKNSEMGSTVCSCQWISNSSKIRDGGLEEGLQVIEAWAIWGNTSRPKYLPAMPLHVTPRTRTGQLQYSGNSKCERHFIPHTVNYISQTLSSEMPAF